MVWCGVIMMWQLLVKLQICLLLGIRFCCGILFIGWGLVCCGDIDSVVVVLMIVGGLGGVVLYVVSSSGRISRVIGWIVIIWFLVVVLMVNVVVGLWVQFSVVI